MIVLDTIHVKIEYFDGADEEDTITAFNLVPNPRIVLEAKS